MYCRYARQYFIKTSSIVSTIRYEDRRMWPHLCKEGTKWQLIGSAEIKVLYHNTSNRQFRAVWRENGTNQLLTLCTVRQLGEEEEEAFGLTLLRHKHCCFTGMYEGDNQGRIMHPFLYCVFNHPPIFYIHIRQFSCCFVWVWNLIVNIAGGKEAEGVWEHGVEENISI